MNINGDAPADDEAILIEKAEAAKAKGNVLFKEAHYSAAIDAYTEAIDVCLGDGDEPRFTDNLHVYYSNRAFCQFKMENYGSCILDAEKAIEVKPGFTKAYYRRGCAYMCLLKYKEAQRDFQAVCKMSNDADADKRLKECNKIIREQKFAAAISSEKTALMSTLVKPEDMTVEDSYKGPVYVSGKVDAKFVQDLTAYIQEPGKVLHKRFAYMIVLDVIKLLKSYKSLVRISVEEGEEFTVCGDVHGQFYDLLNIFKVNGMPSTSNPYLFNGDFVDRGSFSVECIVTLFALKLAYPNHLFLARGNHETKNMNKLYGFEGEVRSKYDETLYQLFCEAFCLLPLAHVINDKVFVVHGGLFSKDGVKLDDIDKIDRNREPPDDGIMTELLWSDPQKENGRAPSKRGVACAFGPDVTRRFLDDNGLSMVIRSHEMKEEGYEVECGGKLVTVFSAPNYCDQMGNKGALVRLKGKSLTPTYKTFAAVPHPPVRPMQYANPMLSFMG